MISNFARILIVFSLFTLSCAQPGTREISSSVPKNESQPLDRRTAMARSSIFAEPRYEIELSLSSNKAVFSGTTRVEFTVLPDPSSLKNQDHSFIDLKSSKLLEVKLNDQNISTPLVKGERVYLPLKLLKKDKNVLIVRYEASYSQSASGLYRFKDPEDGRSYLYTQFEPFDAHKMFPCFDQPNIKGTYTMRIETPSDWKVITSVREKNIQRLKNNRSLWHFPESAKFSTYLISLHAGPYAAWTSNAGLIPLRLFARQSLKKHVNHRDWFAITQQGLRFYGDYFAMKYPFVKYDQVIVPDMGFGAMENVAAVTFNERYVHRGKETLEERETRANTILHEMAHMWFGDLVTMKWWNDLWLNESFATFMASTALERATEFKKSWLTFNLDDKAWAYWEDQLVTTHPIEAPVNDTDEAVSNFDGITYGKGASVMKQLNYLISDANFQKGMQEYFKTYAYRNTELTDFMGSLAKASGHDLDQWTHQWLRTSSLNEIELTWECKDAKISQAVLHQRPLEGFSDLRKHRTEISLYQLKDQSLNVSHVTSLTYESAQTEVKDLIGQSCPDFVDLNHGDNDYVRVKLDPKSKERLRDIIPALKDPLSRALVWTNLWQEVENGQYPLNAFADLGALLMPKEDNLSLLNELTRFFASREQSLTSVLGVLSLSKDYPLNSFSSVFVPRLEGLAWNEYRHAGNNADLKILWADALVRWSSSLESAKNLQTIQNSLDQDRRWGVVFRLASLNDPAAKKLIATELKKDGSEFGQKSALSADAAIPDAQAKKDVFWRIVDSNRTLSSARRIALMRGLFARGQSEFMAALEKDFYSQLAKIAKSEEYDFLDRFTDFAMPLSCTESSGNTLAGFIREHGDLPAFVVKNLKIAHQLNNRCVKMRNLAEEDLKRQGRLTQNTE